MGRDFELREIIKVVENVYLRLAVAYYFSNFWIILKHF